MPSLAVLAAGFATIAVAQTLWPLLLGAVLVGLSYNGVTLPMLTLLGDAVSERQHGPAVGVYQFFGDIGGTIGPIAGIEVATQSASRRSIWPWPCCRRSPFPRPSGCAAMNGGSTLGAGEPRVNRGYRRGGGSASGAG